jgi:lipopolysaccharide export system permease protein
MRPVYDKSTKILYDGKNTFADKQRINDPKLLLPAELNAYSSHLVAKDAFYLEATAEHPAGYLMSGVTQPHRLTERATLSLDKTPVIFMPAEHAAWLKADECFVASELSFEQLTGGRSWRQFASTWELITGLRNPNFDALADVRVAIHARFVQPWLDITLLFLGLPLIVARENRNVYMAIGLCVAVVSLFMLVMIGCQAMGSGYLIGDPAFAAWLPLIIFAPAAAWLAQPFRE